MPELTFLVGTNRDTLAGAKVAGVYLRFHAVLACNAVVDLVLCKTREGNLMQSSQCLGHVRSWDMPQEMLGTGPLPGYAL